MARPITRLAGRALGQILCQTPTVALLRHVALTAYRLEKRVREPEVMDDPGLEERRHFVALEGLARLNRLSAGARHLWPPIHRLAGQLGTDRLRLLDVATGGGGIPIGLWRRARRQGLNLEVTGVDVSPRAVRFARERAERCEADVSFAVWDALGDELPQGYDIVICSLFLHHLDDTQACRLLRAMAASARHLVLVSDLLRGTLNLLMVRFAARLVTRSDVVHLDGERSVRAAFREREVLALAEAAGLREATLNRCFPCRFLLAWRRS